MLSYTILKWHRHNFIDFLDKNLNLRNELNKAFRNKDDTILLITFSSLAYNIGKLVSNLL